MLLEKRPAISRPTFQQLRCIFLTEPSSHHAPHRDLTFNVIDCHLDANPALEPTPVCLKSEAFYSPRLGGLRNL